MRITNVAPVLTYNKTLTWVKGIILLGLALGNCVLRYPNTVLPVHMRWRIFSISLYFFPIGAYVKNFS